MEDYLNVIVILAGIGAVSIYIGIKTFIKQKISCGIHEAVRSGDKLKVVEFIDKGIDLNATDHQNGLTPLHYAFLKKDYPTASLLIENGARLFNRSVDGQTPIDLVQEDETEKIENIILLKHNAAKLTKDKRTPLHLAAEAGDLELSEILLKNDGCDIEIKNSSGMTPLACAVLSMNYKLVEMFIASGADVNACDTTGNTPLLWAAKVDSIDIANALLSAGANINHAEKENGLTALHLTALTDSSDLASFLIEKGASPHLLNYNSHNAYELALNNKNYKVANIAEKAIKSQPVDIDEDSILNTFLENTYKKRDESPGSAAYRDLDEKSFINKYVANSVWKKIVLEAFRKRPPESDEYFVQSRLTFLLTNKALYCFLEQHDQLYNDIKIFSINEIGSYCAEKESIFTKKVRILLTSGLEAAFSISDFPEDEILQPLMHEFEPYPDAPAA